MSFIFSRALVEESSAGRFSDIVASAPSNSTPTPKPCLWHDRTMEPSRLSQFGMTCAPLTESLGAALLMSYLVGSRARTLAPQGKAPVWTANEVGSGRKWLGLLAKFDRASSMWRTLQCSLLGGLDEYWGTWPRWGSMRNGECWERQMSEHRTSGTVSGLWPTPTATDFKSESMSVDLVARRQAASSRGVRLTEFLQRKQLPTPTSGNDHSGGRLDEWGGSTNPFRGTEIGKLRLNPCWVEELMGWPSGSTDLKPLETAKFQQWLQQHGAS